MGRSAKLYKKKPRSKVKQQNKEQLFDRTDAEEALAAKKEHVHARLLGKQDKSKDKSDAASSATERAGQKTRLKSKVWQQLDAQQVKSGKAEFATPKDAGIDYMSQWGRRKAGV